MVRNAIWNTNENHKAIVWAIISGQVRSVYSPPPLEPVAFIWSDIPALQMVLRLRNKTKIITAIRSSIRIID